MDGQPAVTVGSGLRRQRRVPVSLLAVLLLAGCDGPVAAPTPDAPVAETAVPPAPPAACLLDAAALAAGTGVAWTPDQATATDTRCVYDAGGGPSGPTFLTVTLGPLTEADPAAEIETLAQLCVKGTRSALTARDGGFLCRVDGDPARPLTPTQAETAAVYAALVHGDQVVTVSASAVPPATTAARLTATVTVQMARL